MPGTTTTTPISSTTKAPGKRDFSQSNEKKITLVHPGTCEANWKGDCDQGKDKCNHAAGFGPENRYYWERLRCCCKCCNDNVCGDLVC